MTFATGTIQGYVTWISNLTQTPTGRNVVNLLVSVPDKKNKEVSSTYKLSVWDNQTGNVLKYIQPRQLITAQGQLSMEHFVNKNGTSMMRLDFATILDYGRTPEERTQESKSSFVKLDIENLKEVTAAAKRNKVTA
jgi:single-stranded DNA-binding protein